MVLNNFDEIKLSKEILKYEEKSKKILLKHLIQIFAGEFGVKVSQLFFYTEAMVAGNIG